MKKISISLLIVSLSIYLTIFNSCNQPECSIAKKHENGKAEIINCIINESEKYLCHETYFETGDLESKFCTRKDKLSGEVVFFYKSGSLKSKSFYKDDKREGTLINYYENGQIESKCDYKEDVMDGERFGFFKDGRPYYYYFYKNGDFVYFKKYLYGDDSTIIDEVFKPIVKIEKDTLGTDVKHLKFSAELPIPDSLLNGKELYFAYQMNPISFRDSIIDEPAHRFRIAPREKKSVNLPLTESSTQLFYYHVFQKDKKLIMNPTEIIITVLPTSLGSSTVGAGSFD